MDFGVSQEATGAFRPIQSLSCFYRSSGEWFLAHPAASQQMSKYVHPIGRQGSNRDPWRAVPTRASLLLVPLGSSQ